MGTPEFAVEPLKQLLAHHYNIVAVITMPDKPAGRGQQVQQSAVKKFALENGLTVLQPEKLKDPIFIEQLNALKADLQIVVAFRMLPEIVWNMPRLGTFNLHASLLPNYRGAAPINWAVINGEKETGVTTFFLQHEIDTGKIIFQEKVGINENETAGEIHDKLMFLGSELVVKTVQAIETNNYPQINQEQLITVPLKHAPKIFKDDCRIHWNNTATEVHDHIRGLSPYPAAFTDFISPEGKVFSTKIFKTTLTDTIHNSTSGSIDTDSKTYINIGTAKGIVNIEELQIAGKKRMSVSEFLRGFQLNNKWRAE